MVYILVYLFVCVCFLNKERKVVELDGSGGREELGEGKPQSKYIM